jgi:3-hydroxyisobutyrate dehydrogenase-like beta-hydroxyacid dehydrogenase
MGSKVWYVGEQNGFGCSMKLVMNLHLSILAAAFSESIAFGVKLARAK